MDLPARVRALIGPTVEALGFEIVRVRITGQRRRLLQIMAERRDGAAMTVDDCAEISRAASAVLEVEDPIHGSYTLEVSSPGIDRPLVSRRDFERFAGFEAKVELSHPIAGRKRFKGRLLGLKDDRVQIQIEDETVDLPYPEISRAKLVLTDELIAATEERQVS